MSMTVNLGPSPFYCYLLVITRMSVVKLSIMNIYNLYKNDYLSAIIYKRYYRLCYAMRCYVRSTLIHI